MISLVTRDLSPFPWAATCLISTHLFSRLDTSRRGLVTGSECGSTTAEREELRGMRFGGIAWRLGHAGLRCPVIFPCGATPPPHREFGCYVPRRRRRRTGATVAPRPNLLTASHQRHLMELRVLVKSFYGMSTCIAMSGGILVNGRKGVPGMMRRKCDHVEADRDRLSSTVPTLPYRTVFPLS